MFIDVVNACWVPIYNLNLSEDVIGYMAAPDIARSYPWTHLISGHLGLLATDYDVTVHQQYIADIEASSREALASVNPVPYYVADRTPGPGSKATSTPSPNAPPLPSSPNTPACSPPPTSRSSPPPRRSRSCSPYGSTEGTADRFTPDQNAPGPPCSPRTNSLLL